jgi:hypothetical protein
MPPPLVDGERDLVSSTDGLEASMVWYAVDPPSGDWHAFAQQLVAKGCDRQLATLKASMAP